MVTFGPYHSDTTDERPSGGRRFQYALRHKIYLQGAPPCGQIFQKRTLYFCTLVWFISKYL